MRWAKDFCCYVRNSVHSNENQDAVAFGKMCIVAQMVNFRLKRVKNKKDMNDRNKIKEMVT